MSDGAHGNLAQGADLDELLGAQKPRVWAGYMRWGAVGIVVLIGSAIVASLAGGPAPAPYMTGEITRGDIAVVVTATGNLAPTNQIDIGSEISGIVEKVLVDVNGRVAKGQPLAVIDTSRLDDAVISARANLAAASASVAQSAASFEEAKAQLARMQEVQRLSGGRTPSQSEIAAQESAMARAGAALNAAEASVASARAQVSSSQTQVAKAIIRSPVAGLVLKRTIDPGQTVQAAFNTPSLFIIAEDLTQMKLEVSIDEADVGLVKEGQNAAFTVDAYPGRSFPAVISRVNLGAKNLAGSTSTSAASGANVVSYLATLSLSNADMRLRPGMTATATITVEGEKDVLRVPNAALRFAPQETAEGKQQGFTIRPPDARDAVAQERQIGIGSRQTVYLLAENGLLRAAPVVTGASDGRVTAVRPLGDAKLAPGMRVVTGAKAKAEP